MLLHRDASHHRNSYRRCSLKAEFRESDLQPRKSSGFARACFEGATSCHKLDRLLLNL
jgi:hypothetical protein